MIRRYESSVFFHGMLAFFKRSEVDSRHEVIERLLSAKKELINNSNRNLKKELRGDSFRNRNWQRIKQTACKLGYVQIGKLKGTGKTGIRQTE